LPDVRNQYKTRADMTRGRTDNRSTVGAYDGQWNRLQSTSCGEVAYWIMSLECAMLTLKILILGLDP
jgi:hypothetical protein